MTREARNCPCGGGSRLLLGKTGSPTPPARSKGETESCLSCNSHINFLRTHTHTLRDREERSLSKKKKKAAKKLGASPRSEGLWGAHCTDDTPSSAAMDNTGGGEPDTSDTIDVLKCLRCAQEGCTNVPGLGYQGEGPTMCTEHAAPAMVQIVHLRCEQGDCSARRTFGYDGGAARLCAIHKLDGMVDLMKRRSQVSACLSLTLTLTSFFCARRSAISHSTHRIEKSKN